MAVLASISFAHLDSGQDITVGSYLADFGYSPANITAGEEAILAFNLGNATTGEGLQPESVWIRISKGDAVLFAGAFAPQAGNVAFTYVFPEAGAYGVKARYFGSEHVLAEADFSVQVDDSSSYNFLPAAFLALLVTLIIAAYLRIKAILPTVTLAPNQR